MSNTHNLNTASEQPAIPVPETSIERVGKTPSLMRIELSRTLERMASAESCTHLTDWERIFLADIGLSFKTYGLATRLSVTQMLVLNRILAKAAAH